MNTHNALLQAVIDDPADDFPRMAYADWCEEEGQNERAELIRTQLLIARYGRPWIDSSVSERNWIDGLRHIGGGHFLAVVPDYGAPQIGDRLDGVVFTSGRHHKIVRGLVVRKSETDSTPNTGSKRLYLVKDDLSHLDWRKKLLQLHKRAHEIMSSNAAKDWIGKPLKSIPYCEYDYSKGFVSRIALTLVQWMRYGVQLIQQHPIQDLAFGTDCEPQRSIPAEGGDGSFYWTLYSWNRDKEWVDRRSGPCVLPLDIYENLPPHTWEGGSSARACFASAEGARQALVKAALQWAKDELKKQKEKEHERSVRS